MIGSRLRGVLALSVAEIRYNRRKSAIAIVGIALAVLGTILLSSVGVGVVDFGQQQFATSDRDLWMTGGVTEFRPGSVGGVQNGIVDSHALAANISERPAVATAVPLMFQTVYASPNTSSFATVAGVGGPARGPSVDLVAGRQINESRHYANGTYDGPMRGEVVIDERAATLLDVAIGDTLHVGGTVATARQYEFTVVGLSNTYSQFVGAPTVVLPHSELQTLTGKTATDPATFVSIRLLDDDDAERVARDLQRDYPDYDVRTNEEQMQAILRDQAVVIASGVSLVGLAIVAGVALTLNLLLSMLYQQRRTLAAAKAIGVSPRLLTGTVLVRALVLAVLGGGLGAALSVPGVWVTNRVAEAVTGFEGLAAVSVELVFAGFGMALCIGLVGGLLSSVYLYRSSGMAELRG